MTANHPAAGKPVDPASLANVPRLVTAYFASKPDAADPAQRVAFGTSGHRGSSLKNSFNEDHILATTQAICDHRRESGLTGPLFIGIDTHALAEPALASAIEVFAANGVNIM
ncbi:MAG: phosphoglucomutase, alpha-D-glucose phosphate-specific, partial [Bradyrhizobium sp.]